ncbi:MAG: enoyl-CoA hydratase/isomerase family protein [Gammaproteobacteria bacterium]|nr:enoyl-CoA hydratase/isomerase family protein [Gammaproteobacteria bacterium]
MSHIKVDRDGPVITITLARPEKRNALNLAMLEELAAAFKRPVEASDRVIVLRSEGRVFCAGIDLAERQRNPAGKGASPIEPVLEAMEHHALPIVGVVQGAAIAGGNELALHCDFVVASNEARFGMSLAQIGLAPTWFLCKKLMEVAGPVATREILLLGDPLPAQRMYELGIISRVCEPQDLEAQAARIIDRLAANAPLSLRAMKALIVREMQFRDGIEHADIDEMVQAARDSQDAREGIAARLEKRQPQFRGA